MIDGRSAWRPSASQSVAMSVASARNATLIGAKVIRIQATCPFFFKLGDNTVVAALTDHYSDGMLEYLTLEKDTSISVILASSTGTLYISECA